MRFVVVLLGLLHQFVARAWKAEFPLHSSGALYTVNVSWPAGNFSGTAVLDTGSNDAAVAVPSHVLGNITTIDNRTEIISLNAAHSLFVDGAVARWPGVREDQPGSRVALVRTNITVLTTREFSAERLNLPAAAVLFSASFSISSAATALRVSWEGAASVLGILGGTEQLARPGAFRVLSSSLALQYGGNSSSTPRYAVLHIRAHGLGSLVLSDSWGEVKSAVTGSSDWKWPPPTMALTQPPLAFSSARYDASVCGSRLLLEVHRLQAVLDTGAACLTLPSEAFSRLMNLLGGRVRCPQAGDGIAWPSWAVQADGTALQCQLVATTKVEDLPWMTWSTQAHSGPIFLPLSSLVLSVNDTAGSSAPWLCIRRGPSVAAAVAAATPSVARVIMGSMVLRSMSVVLDYATHRFALQSKHWRNATHEFAAAQVVTVGSEQPYIAGLAKNMQHCNTSEAKSCVSGSVYDGGSGSCRSLQAACDVYAFFDWQNGECRISAGFAVFMCILGVAFFVWEVMLLMYADALDAVTAALKGQSQQAYSDRLHAAYANLRETMPALYCVFRCCSKSARAVRQPAREPTASGGDSFGSFVQPDSSTRGAFTSS